MTLVTWTYCIYQPRAFRRFKCERQSCSLFTGQYVTVLTPGYTLRARDATRKEGRGLHSGSAFPREPRRPSACTSHPVAGQRQQRSFLYFRDFHISTILCARALVYRLVRCMSNCRSHTGRLKDAASPVVSCFS